jgi:hypothetical protein
MAAWRVWPVSTTPVSEPHRGGGGARYLRTWEAPIVDARAGVVASSVT